MEAVAKCYTGRKYQHIWFECLVNFVAMHRLTLDKYLSESIEQGLIKMDREGKIFITQKGVAYLEQHGIIEG